MKTKKTKEYPYIWAWGRYMRSYEYYMEDQEFLAKQDKAPKTAIYKRDSTKKWVTVDEISNGMLRLKIEQDAKAFM